MTNVAPRYPEGSEKYFQASYGEVLSALKHQDDKLGRVLTAVAFLTSGGLTLFGLTRTVSLPYTQSLWAYLLVAFLTSIASTVLLTLAGIDPTGLVPDRYTAIASEQSLLFYQRIHTEPETEWEKLATSSADDLRSLLAKNYHDDARRLTGRVIYKIWLSNLAQACLQVAVVILALLGIFLLNAGAVVSWAAAAALIGTAGALPLFQLVVQWRVSFPGINTAWRRSLALTVAALCLIGIAMGVGISANHEAICLALALVFLVGERVVTASSFGTEHPRRV